MHTEAQIYLQSHRGQFQKDGFRSYYTFNFGDYQAQNREPTGSLLALNDNTLLPQCSHEITVTEPTNIMLLPLVGAIEIIDESEIPKYVNSGESLSFMAKPGKRLSITNPYPDEVINYLEIRFVIPDPSALVTDQFIEGYSLSAFDLNIKNTLIPISDAGASNQNLLIGKYDGRQEGVYSCQNPSTNVFIFIIQGAFEVQNRLLEKRDGLMLKNVQEVEFEALSNEAILLVIDF